MKKFVFGFVLLLLLGGVAFKVLGGMTLLDGMGLRGDERQVRSRMDAYWDARVQGDLQEMAEYAHPQESSFMQPGALITEAFEIQSVELREDKAVATVKVRSRIKQAAFSSRTRELVIKDPWVRFEGNWYQEPGPVTMQDLIRQYRGEWTPPVVGKDAPPPVQ